MNDAEQLPIRTKIVATIGPASRSPAVLRRLIDAGVNVFRLNFSHGTHEEHSAVLADIRAISREMGRHVAVLQDLCGPKMRLGPIPGDLVECPLGEEFTLVTERRSDDPHELTCSYCDLPNDLKPGETVLFADGTVAMEVIDVAAGRARLKVTLSGRLRSKQGLNLPGSNLAVKSLTDKDLQDLDWTARHGADVEYVGLSFVRSAGDVAWLRRELDARKCTARIVVKIEKPQAVQNLEAIIAATDGVMVARGDLGVEMDVQRVPAIQKRVIGLCNSTHRPVITATQMLQSMEHSSRPTRAEASDVFNAVVDGTDAVMLSGETAIGEFPVEAVATMRQICFEAEAYLEAGGRPPYVQAASLKGFVEPITEAAVDAAYLINERLNASVVVVATESGRTALALSNRRPTSTILAVTRTEQLARRLAVCWGVTAMVQPETAMVEQELSSAMEWAKSRRLVRSGDYVVLVRGQVPGEEPSRAVLTRQVS
ncbi:MAG TPA: pyruvate kinase [Gemmataceae bacterium]|jgi:pyruvate kinase|nr:pyruvate kinase [Gemmataceae bacterium]